MTIGKLLETLRERDVRVWMEGDRVRVSAPSGSLTPELRKELAERKEAIRGWLLERQDRSSALPDVLEDDAEQRFPVSFAQRRLWFLDHLDPGNSAYNIAAWLPISNPVEADLLEAAINDVLRRQQSLRTVFREEGGDPVQIVLPYRPVPLERLDLTGLPEAERAAEAERIRVEEAKRPFDLAAGPLFRARLLKLDEHHHQLLLTMHHIISDLWSVGILSREVSERYAARREGKPASFEPLAIQYGDYARDERERLEGGELERLLGYWRTRLAGAPPTLELPTDRPRPARQTFNGAVMPFEIPEPVSNEIRAFARRERVTVYMTLLAVFNALLSRYSGQTDIVVGTPLASRPTPELERLIGLFVSTLAIRTDLGSDPDARALVAQVRETVLEAQAYNDLPFEKLVEALSPERTMAHSPIFQVVFALQNTPLSSAFNVTSAAAMYDLSVFVWDLPGSIRGSFEYNTDLFERETIARMASHFCKLAEAFVAEPGRPVSQLPVLSIDERRQLLEWGTPESSYPRDATVAQLFAAVAAQRPLAPALESADLSSEIFPADRLTYGELDDITRRLAARLRERGVGPEGRVGLYVDRSIGAIVSILAIVRTGAAYVPLDPGDPPSRTGEILSDAGVHVVLTQRALVGRLPSGSFRPVTLEDEWERAQDADTGLAAPEIEAGSLAYVMFTSGTTGRPKGVCVTHRNIVRLVRNTNYVHLGPDEVVLQFAPLAFDASTLEIWGALLNGARLVVHPQRLPTAKELARTLQEQKITLLWLTAGFFHYMIENEVDALARVRQVLAGGDVLSVTHVQKLLDAKRDGVVVNGYGPTENTTFTCCHVMSPSTQLANFVPIGRPIANTSVYILDAAGAPVPVGVVGELFAGGDGVARGYLDDADASRGKFVPDPFSARAGATMYRTGDLARWLPDGTIEFLGRRDRQVKIRGFRIELEEIEGALRAWHRVKDAAVVVRPDAAGTNILVAYVVPRAGDALDEAELRRYLAGRLPEYMLPAAFVALRALPLTANGKLDRNALPEPERRALAPAVEPRTKVETQLMSIWEHVLGRSGFGVHENFFELGGHSLLAVRLFAQVEKVFGRRLPVSALFQAPTVAELAARLEKDGFRSPWDSLVAIQPDGVHPPLFLVPGIGGNVAGYADLARLLGRDQPLYGLQSRGLDGLETPFDRIEPMAAHYVSEIRKVQPTGPYYLGGACFGGAVAYEMAQQLRAAGEEIAFLMLLETWPPPRRRPIIDALVRQSVSVRFLLSATARNLAKISTASPRRMLSMTFDGAKAIGEMIAQRDIYRGDRAAMYVDRVSIANRKAFSLYEPRPFDGSVQLVLATGRFIRTKRDPRLFWGRLAQGGYSKLEIPAADSGLVLKSPFVEVLAPWMSEQLLRSRLERADVAAPLARETTAIMA